MALHKSMDGTTQSWAKLWHWHWHVMTLRVQICVERYLSSALTAPLWRAESAHSRIFAIILESQTSTPSLLYLIQHHFCVIFFVWKIEKLIYSNYWRCRKVSEFTMFINDLVLQIRQPEVPRVYTLHERLSPDNVPNLTQLCVPCFHANELTSLGLICWF